MQAQTRLVMTMGWLDAGLLAGPYRVRAVETSAKPRAGADHGYVGLPGGGGVRVRFHEGAPATRARAAKDACEPAAMRGIRSCHASC